MRTSRDVDEYLSTRLVFEACGGAASVVVDAFHLPERRRAAAAAAASTSKVAGAGIPPSGGDDERWVEPAASCDDVGPPRLLSSQGETPIPTRRSTAAAAGGDGSPALARASTSLHFTMSDATQRPAELQRTSYFLSHFHSDHYTGLTRNFSDGHIYCSEITKRHVVRQLGVPEHRVTGMRLNETYRLDAVDGALVDPRRADLAATQVDVVLLDANHCPGAVMFAFRSTQRTVIHTGDMRFSPPRPPVVSQSLLNFGPRASGGEAAREPAGNAASFAARFRQAPATSNRSGKISSVLGPRVTRPKEPPRPTTGPPAKPVAATSVVVPDDHPLQPYRGKVDVVYLDNTFCDDKYELPTQQDAMRLGAFHARTAVASAMRRVAAAAPADTNPDAGDRPPPRPPRVAVLFGAYTIGKERMAMGTRDELGANEAPIYASEEKLQLLRDSELATVGNFRVAPTLPPSSDAKDEDGKQLAPVIDADAILTPATVVLNGAGASRVECRLAFLMAPMMALSERHVGGNCGHVHLADSARLNVQDFDAVVGISPTGWANRAGPSGKTRELGHVSFVSVPYSEHSSFSELIAFVKLLQPRSIVPTVSQATYARFENRFAEVCPALKRLSGVRSITEFISVTRSTDSAAADVAAVAAPPKKQPRAEAPEVVDVDDDDAEVEVIDLASDDDDDD